MPALYPETQSFVQRQNSLEGNLETATCDIAQMVPEASTQLQPWELLFGFLKMTTMSKCFYQNTKLLKYALHSKNGKTHKLYNWGFSNYWERGFLWKQTRAHPCLVKSAL